MRITLTQQAHEIIRQHFSKPDVPMNLAVDATCGNGHDSLFLAQLGFTQLLALDVQDAAVKATRSRLEAAGFSRAQVRQTGHQHLGDMIDGQADCIMFNLGYLPGGKKEITTRVDTTLTALSQASEILSNSGIISLMCYPGHAAGASEASAVEQWSSELGNERWSIERFDAVRPTATTPFLLVLRQPSNNESAA